MKGTFRRAAVAGTFYPADKGSLREEVAAYMREATVPSVTGRPIALISPHAGYAYSGKIAAHGYSLLREVDIEVAVITAPSHRVPFSGSTIYDGGAYSTPLGILSLNDEVAQSLVDSCDSVEFSSAGHGAEHSLEVQLPFLQESLTSPFTLVPIIMGDQTQDSLEELARGLESALGGKRALLVASSDLSHFHRAEEAEELDRNAMDYIENLDADGLHRAVMNSECEACGIYPIVAMMKAVQREDGVEAHILSYGNSGDATGDYSEVVGYLSAAFTAV